MAENNNDSKLKGKLAVVTGAARGLGRVIAQKLASMGADIVSIDLDSSDETITAVEKLGGNASSYIADLTNEERVNKVFAGIIQEYQGIDMLINNAGFYSVERRPFWEIGLDEWEKVMTINVRSVFLCSRAVAKTMRDAGSGCIVNISSSAITFGMPNLMHYVAAKSAVIGMTRSMARELGLYGINVNAVAPGLVATDTALESVRQEVVNQVVRGQAIQQPLDPQDIAGAVAYLCSPEAHMVTGQTILVNGGATVSGV